MTTTQFDPDKWVTSFFRALVNYAQPLLRHNNQDVYDVIESYPPLDELTTKVPLAKTLIHFDIEDMEQVFFGLGENIVFEEYRSATHDVESWEAHCHIVRMDVGVWASIESGGPSARLEARQDLDRIFNGPAARDNCMTATDGVEILGFTGGRFLTDAINDLPVFRIVDQELRVRVYSRTKVLATAIESIDQDPQLSVGTEVLIG